MFFKKISERNEMSGVRMVNGIIKFQAIQLNVHCFEVDGVLIDTGAKSLLNQFKPFFKEMDVDQIVLTHYHEDHSGGAQYLQNEYQLPVYMNELKIQECKEKATYPFYRRAFWGRRPAFHAQAIGTTFESRNATWRVIETPGHTQDHLAFLNTSTGQIFTGDLYVSPKTKLVLREESVPTIISSIENLLTYDFQEGFCNHAGYMKDAKKELTKKLDYLCELSERIESLRREGRSVKEINEKLFMKKYPITRVSSGEWDSTHIVTSVIGKGN
ncbi:MBL fold metallo-hydrolase [Solibacillus sp. R5-41]|uniref:MBL fold metallo-hydrolase n=1 Tax=Solibacillus sp. R5-41 TaxID=2048654 RepID=UPI000C128A81|nr:MBL fold metallo-hydrolase [Solibacillus sp. R5-41]ATP39694.1 MBL fold metallo-hydrolase [Solibacillus sp. R5-41]